MQIKGELTECSGLALDLGSKRLIQTVKLLGLTNDRGQRLLVVFGTLHLESFDFFVGGFGLFDRAAQICQRSLACGEFFREPPVRFGVLRRNTDDAGEPGNLGSELFVSSLAPSRETS